MLNFKDITTQKQLKLEEEQGRLLRTLCTSIHHEVIGPLKVTIECAHRIMRQTNSHQIARMGKTIHLTSKLLLLHANDLLDQRIIENDGFIPVYA